MSGRTDQVGDYYASRAAELAADRSCCEPAATAPPACCDAYPAEELHELGLNASISLGCGNPVLLADLRNGDRVLDLGSGGGLDVLLSARRVAPDGHAYGVDMTDPMLELAERNRIAAGVGNATFLKGAIDRVPLPDGSVDVVISNCVVNLAEDKSAVLREALRVLRPGGRLAIADTVRLAELPPEVVGSQQAWSCCIAGALPVDTYRTMLLDAGFESPEIQVVSSENVGDVPDALGSAYVRARRPD